MITTIREATSLRIHVLASGSKGNATIIENTAQNKALLVDCGIGKRDFFARCAEVGVNPLSIEGILVSHEHRDHTKGLGVVLRGLAQQGVFPTLYTTKKTRETSSEINELQKSFDVKLFSQDTMCTIAGIETLAFSTSHDAADSCGFHFSHDADTIGVLTDTGIVHPQAFEALQNCRILALESNHDTRMLETGPYPYNVKQRVASDLGHLSNAQAADALECLLSNTLEHVIALHVSENNNTYRLPVDALEARVSRNGHHAQVYTAYQHRTVSV